ncbi:hypothetical protein O181_034667 [Austropuccinia psidii MF-1]|uniref:Reverse transcriptase domain-containing protein n=1 Tax=Austropuccinia psidii MF-1 TaxID=1389203 RepID=A0A9Q3H8A4_9BASI|nr:hypothetical protein [Austropuccinia psidii MF-1]
MPHHKKNKKGKQSQASKDKPHDALLNKHNKLIGSERERRIKEGLYSPKGEDLTLAYDFLYHLNPIIDWKNGLITYDSSQKDSSGINSSTNNYVAIALNSVALVGELKTPSHPSSVHIPSIMPSQSLLQSREKRCWGRCCYILTSSLSRGYGPSSFIFSFPLEEQWDEEEEPEEIETVLMVVPSSYHQYLDIFSKVKEEKLSPHRNVIIISNWRGFYLQPSSSLTGAPVLFVKKKDSGLYLCVDYCKINAVTRKNRYPFPPMNQLLTISNGSTIFSKMGLCVEYNLLRIKEGDEHLTSFITKYGIYEYLVIPFGLTNAPASFQNLVNDIFADFLNIFVGFYLDDIMVFSSSQEEHVKHVASVLQRLRDNNLFSKASNPRTSKLFNTFLALPTSIVSSLKITLKRITALTSLLKKDSPFLFNEEDLGKLQILKESFTTAPILSNFNPSLPTILETDASYYALGAVLRQVNDSGKHPIEFDSCKLLPAELNYEIHDKELLGIVLALKSWRDFLLSLSNSFEVLTYHSSLQYFMSSKVLDCCQAHWAEYLSESHFTITYHPGRLDTLPDSLSLWDNIYPERGMDFIRKNPKYFHQGIKQDGIQESRFFSTKVEIFSDLNEQIQKEVWQDKDYN